MGIQLSTELRLAYLKAAADAISQDEAEIAAYRELYEGEQGVELTDRMKEFLGGLGETAEGEAIANIAKRCVGIPLERLNVRGFSPKTTSKKADSLTPDQTYVQMLEGWWMSNRMNAAQQEVYRFALRDKVSAVMVSWDAQAKQPIFTVHELWDGENGTLRLHYSPEDGELLYVSKRWRVWDPLKPQELGRFRLTLYTPSTVERWEETQLGSGEYVLMSPKALGLPANPQPWTMDGTPNGEPIGLSIIPFWNPGYVSEIADVRVIQKALNKGLVDLIGGSDTSGFPVTWATGISLPTGSDGQPVTPVIDPGRLLHTENSAAKFGRLEAADLSLIFNSGVMSWLTVASFVKGWPLYLWDKSNSTPPSGEAMKHLESSLIAQVLTKQSVFGDSWNDVMAMGERLARAFNPSQVTPTGEFTLDWEPPFKGDPLADMQINEIKWRSAEIPRIQRWRELNYSEEVIAQMLQEEAEQQNQEAQRTLEMTLAELEKRNALTTPGTDPSAAGNQEGNELAHGKPGAA